VSSPAVEGASDPPPSMLVPMIVLAAATIYFGIETRLNAGIAGLAAQSLVGGLR
jgi:multicomponent Na+:H+ antiporter subunit D